MNSANSTLTAITRALHESLNFSKSKVIRDFCAILSCHLCSIRSVLLRTTETHLTC